MRWSIILCTFNRAMDLAAVLERLSHLSYPADEHEIVVVDNASSDDTPAVIIAASGVISNLVSVREEKPGLSHARNRGITEARGEFVAFIDDDAWPDLNWLHALDAGFGDQNAGSVGGRVEAVWPQDPLPGWLSERLFCYLSLVDHGTKKYLQYPDYPAGTNIAFRKSVLLDVGLFSECLGRIGTSLLSMEEVDLCLRIEDAGYKVLYQPDAVVHHIISSNRLSKEWFEQRSRCQGISGAIIEAKRFTYTKLALKILKYLTFIAVGAIGSIVFACLRNERLAFFCRCQTILCKAYIRLLLSSSWIT